MTKKKSAVEKKWYWNDTHQQAFDLIKKILARDVMLAYPQYGELVEIDTEVSTRNLGAITTQN